MANIIVDAAQPREKAGRVDVAAAGAVVGVQMAEVPRGVDITAVEDTAGGTTGKDCSL